MVWSELNAYFCYTVSIFSVVVNKPVYTFKPTEQIETIYKSVYHPQTSQMVLIYTFPLLYCNIFILGGN